MNRIHNYLISCGEIFAILFVLVALPVEHIQILEFLSYVNELLIVIFDVSYIWSGLTIDDDYY